MKTIAVIGAVTFACVFVTLSGEPAGIIKDSDDLARGVKLMIRVGDGDTSFGNDLDALESLVAAGSYLAGFRDCASIATFVLKQLNVNHLFDIPDGVTVAQLARVVDKYMIDHPEQLHEPPGILVFNALLQAFPNKTDSRVKAVHGPSK